MIDRSAIAYGIRRDPTVVYFVAFLVAALILSISAPILPVGDPEEIGAGPRLASPGMTYWMGTDNLGRPLLARVLDGILSTFVLSTIAVVIAALIGGISGILAGYFTGLTDEGLSRIADVMFSFPPLLLGLLIVAFLHPGVESVIAAIIIYTIPTMFRVVRASALNWRGEDFVTIAQVIKIPLLRILFVHIGLNILPVLVTQIIYSISLAMLLESSLSFLGLGVQPPGASLGSLIRDSLIYLEIAPWLLLFPGLILAMIILSINQLGDTLAIVFDPKER